MLSLGAVGVWMGTRFIASQEAHAGQMYRDVIVEATDEDTVRTKSYSGKPMRVKKNAWVEDWESRPGDIQPFPMQARTFVIVYGALELFFGVTGTASGVAHFAHLGGMLGGWLMILYRRNKRIF